MMPVGHGATHSTWNPRTLRWDYWRAPVKLRAGVIAPAPRIAHRELGVAPEDATRPLPAGAVKIGSGQEPRGLVAGRKALGDVASIDPFGLVVGGLALYLLLR